MKIRFKGVFIGWISEGNFEFFFQPILRPFPRICFLKINSVLPVGKTKRFRTTQKVFRSIIALILGKIIHFAVKIFTRNYNLFMRKPSAVRELEKKKSFSPANMNVTAHSTIDSAEFCRNSATSSAYSAKINTISATLCRNPATWKFPAFISSKTRPILMQNKRKKSPDSQRIGAFQYYLDGAITICLCGSVPSEYVLIFLLDINAV